MGGSGGSSGNVEYPNYIENMQALLMTNRPHWSYGDAAYNDASDGAKRDWHRHPPHSWEDFIDNWTSVAAEGAGDVTANTQGVLYTADTMIDLNPYTNVVSYDPDTNSELIKIADAITALDTEIDGMDTYIQDELNAFVDESKLEHYRSMAVMAGSFRDVNATTGTAFLQGITSHQINHDNKLARARGEAFKTRSGLKERRAALQIEASRIQITARTDQVKEDLALSTEDVNWEMDVLGKALEGIGAITGVATVGSNRTKKSSGLVQGLLGIS